MTRRITLPALVLALLALMAVPAWAHVTVSPREATRDGFATLTFQVPNEKDNANTTKLEVQFPQENPIADASVRPVPGWTVEVAKQPLETSVTTDEGDELTEAVDTITWTSTGAGIAPGFFEQFQVSLRLPAEGDSVTFPALQTYSDGEIVRWIQLETPGGEEPESPAPVLTLTDGEDEAPTATTVPTTTPQAEESEDEDSDALGIIAIIVGGVALLAALGALAAGRRRKAN